MLSRAQEAGLDHVGYVVSFCKETQVTKLACIDYIRLTIYLYFYCILKYRCYRCYIHMFVFDHGLYTTYDIVVNT